MKNKFFKKKIFIKKKKKIFKEDFKIEEQIFFLKEKFDIHKNDKNITKIIDIILPNKIFTLKDFSNFIKIRESKIKSIIKLLKLDIKNYILPYESILILDCLNIISVLKDDDIDLNNKINIKSERNYNNVINKNILITLIGNVDNGKTSLINKLCKNIYIEKKNLITQGIEINYKNINNKEFIFLDTPGHKDLENFKNFTMKISDIILLVINSFENINNNIINIIEFSKKNNLLLIVNINKIDIIKNKNELIEKKFLELKIKYKYNYIINKTSIKKNTGLNKLNKFLIFISKLVNFEFYMGANFKGLIMENSIDKELGLITTILIEQGVLKKGDFILSDNKWCIIKSIYNHKNELIDETNGNNLIKLIGFNELPNINNIIIKIYNKNLLKKLSSFRSYKNNLLKSENKTYTQKELKSFCENPNIKKKLNLIIKSKTNGILNSIKIALSKIKFNSFELNYINSAAGDIKKSDIKLAKIVNAVLIAFDIKINNNIKLLSKNYKLEIISYNVIYDVINYIKNIDSKKEDKKFINVYGIAKVTKVFKIFKKKTIAGCFVIYGKINLLNKIKIFRKNKEIYAGSNINSIKYLKENVREVKKNVECGIYIDNFNNYEINDIIKLYNNKY